MEYQAMIEKEKPTHRGLISEELVSPRGDNGYMVLQGTGVRCATRQSRARVRALSSSKSSPFEHSDHRTDHSGESVESCDPQNNQSECSVRSGDPVSEMEDRLAELSDNFSNQNTTVLNGEGNSVSDDEVNLHHSR